MKSPGGSGFHEEGPLAIICGGGSLPFTVADAVRQRGRTPVLFPLRGWADPARVTAYRHRWNALGQFGRICANMRAEGCRDVVFIGTLSRPPLWRLRFDFGTLRILPRLFRAYRGGDNHLLGGMASAFEHEGFRVAGAHEVAPEILVPQGALGRRQPGEADRHDIVLALELLDATGKFDIGQGAIVARNRVLAVEAAEGTDAMLTRVADLRARHGKGEAGGVLVKAPKPGQDWRFDLPSIGPQTVEGAARAGLGGIAVLAGGAVIAEPQRVVALADKYNIFVAGVARGGTII